MPRGKKEEAACSLQVESGGTVSAAARKRRLAMRRNDMVRADFFEREMINRRGETVKCLAMQAHLLAEYLEGSDLFADRRDVLLARQLALGLDTLT